MPNFILGSIFVVGWAVCLIGGIGITAALGIWSLDRVLNLTGTVNIIAQWWLAKKFPNRFKG